MKSVVDINVDAQYADTIDIDNITHLVNSDLSKLDIRNYLVELIFVNNDFIHKLNNQHRGINHPTDVLSFPQANPDNSKLNFLGSIVVSPDMVKEKEETISDAIKHGLLHLIGYDHEIDTAAWEEKAAIIDCNL